MGQWQFICMSLFEHDILHRLPLRQIKYRGRCAPLRLLTMLGPWPPSSSSKMQLRCPAEYRHCCLKPSREPFIYRAFGASIDIRSNIQAPLPSGRHRFNHKCMSTKSCLPTLGPQCCHKYNYARHAHLRSKRYRSQYLYTCQLGEENEGQGRV